MQLTRIWDAKTNKINQLTHLDQPRVTTVKQVN